MADEQPEILDDVSETPESATTDSQDEAPEPDLEALQAELAAAKDAAMRAQADAINAQRRAEQEVDKARKFALERFCRELLPVVDNMERGLASALEGDAGSAVVEGLELTLKSFADVLSKSGVSPVDPAGEPFDPQTAQAMSMIENPDVEPNTVLNVMQKGYTLNGRLLRPAMVIVSKAAG